MRHVLYRCVDSGFECRSLCDLRVHVESFNSVDHRNAYDGEFVHRYIYRDGSWQQDDMFLRRIFVINSRVRFQNFSLRWNRHFAKS